MNRIMMPSIRLLSLSLALAIGIANAKPSDFCKAATKVSTLPFSVTPSTGTDEFSSKLKVSWMAPIEYWTLHANVLIVLDGNGNHCGENVLMSGGTKWLGEPIQRYFRWFHSLYTSRRTSRVAILPQDSKWHQERNHGYFKTHTRGWVR